MEQQEVPPAVPQRRRLRATGLVGVGLAGGLVLAGLGVASAQSADPTPSPNASVAPGTPGAPGRPGKGGHGKGGGLLGFGRGALHGEVTTVAPSGGYQTLAMQVGEVTAVSGSSVTVKSADGYSRTYVVNDNTLVNAGNDGIGDVKTGDDVRVTALVTGGTASAVEVMDVTQVGELRGRWAPRPKAPSPSPS